MQTNSSPLSSIQERLVHLLSNILIEVNSLQTLVDGRLAEERLNTVAVKNGLQTLEQMTREAIQCTRAAGEELLPAELEGRTLAEVLSHMVEEVAERLGLSSRVSFSGVDEQGRPKEHTLSRAAERVLYLVTQQALDEVEQHVGARKLRLVLNYGPEEVQLGLEDDGLIARLVDASGDGVSPFAALPSEVENLQRPHVTTSILKDLRCRVENLGGTLEVSPLGERGNRFQVRIPYESHLSDAVTVSEIVVAPLFPSEAESTALVPAQAVEEIRILLVEPQAVTRAGLRRLLESYPGLHVIGEASDGVQAVSETMELGPQIVIMDAQLPNGQSLEALRQIKQLNLDTKVLLLSAQEREEYLYETLRAGADGYLLKDISPDELAQAVHVVARGEVLVQPQLAGRLLSQFGRRGRDGNRYDALTARELEVLRLLARGLRNKEIAAQLYVSERTVNFHLANIYQKLNVSGRTEALSKALERGLITA